MRLFNNYKFHKAIDVLGGHFFFVCLLASYLALAILSLVIEDNKDTANMDCLVMVVTVFLLSQVPVPVKVRHETDVKQPER